MSQNNDQRLMIEPHEQRVYDECMQNAFFKKGVPYGGISILVAHLVCKTGVIRKHPTYGFLGTLVAAGACGTIMGIVSQRYTCLQKVLNLPNSTLRRRMEEAIAYNEQARYNRDSRRFPEQKPLIREPTLEAQAPMVSSLQVEGYQGPHDFDTYSGLNAETNVRDDFTMEPLDKFTGVTTSYEELRRKNREEYSRSRLPPQSEYGQPGPNSSGYDQFSGNYPRYEQQPSNYPRSNYPRFGDGRQPNPSQTSDQDFSSDKIDLSFDRDRPPQYQFD